MSVISGCKPGTDPCEIVEDRDQRHHRVHAERNRAPTIGDVSRRGETHQRPTVENASAYPRKEPFSDARAVITATVTGA